MKNTVLKFGLLSLLLGAILFMLGLTLGGSLDFSTQEVIGYSTMVASLVFVFFGIKHYRDRVNDGKVSFGKAFLLGFLISVFAGIGFGIVDYIYTTVINPDFAQEYLSTMLSNMEASMSAAEFETQKEALTTQMEAYGGSGFMAFIMFATVVMIGLVITLISALILQRK
jgi:predicted membrane protein